jgi:hypothetical protein
MLNYFGSVIRKSFTSFEEWRDYSNSRKIAKNLADKVIQNKGASVVDKKAMRRIKEYADERFGSPDFWPWLALYTEIRGEFKEGWIPDDFYSHEMIPKFNPESVSMLSTIKSFDHRLFPEFSLQPLGIIVGGTFYSSNQKKLDFSEIKAILDDYSGEVVIKRDEGRSGDDIIFKQSCDVQISDFKKNDNYLIQPSIKQHDDINKLYGNSVNTIRIATYLTDSGEVEVVLKIMRFGRGNSRIDNLVGGGGFISLDNEGQASVKGYDNSGLILGEKHPDTGFKFDQLKIPLFGEILESCKKSHLSFPYVKYIAWDVCVTNKNEIKILEWNTRKPAFWCFEATIGPLWNENLVQLD